MKNVAPGKNVTSSAVGYNAYPEKAVDGKCNSGKNSDDPKKSACSYIEDEPSWIKVDLGETYVIAALSLVGRIQKDGYDHQSNNWTIRIGNSTDINSGVICQSNVNATGGYSIPVFCDTNVTGRYVMVSSDRMMVLCELQVLIRYGNLLQIH